MLGLVQSQSVSPQKSAGHQKKEVATSNATVIYLKAARLQTKAYPRLFRSQTCACSWCGERLDGKMVLRSLFYANYPVFLKIYRVFIFKKKSLESLIFENTGVIVCRGSSPPASTRPPPLQSLGL